MSPLPAPVLNYSKQADPRSDVPRGWRWVAYVLAALPWAAVLSVHLLYAVEWFVNGERPNPTHHGADNAVEEVLYDVSAWALLVFVLSVSGSFLLPFVAYPIVAKRTPLVLFLPLGCWFAALVILTVDPFRAMYFWLD